MKLLTTGLLASAAVAAAQEQQVLNAGGPVGGQREPSPSIFDETLRQFQTGVEEGVTHFWSEMKTNFKDYLPLISLPKKHTRRPDSEWDHIMRGADVESVWVEGADGEKRREVDGKLENYGLRVKAVNPADLGIDPGVKQYSGYLDDNEADKHLFYC
ncbi:hypothetical protein FQN49_008098 [Arthroderma sp. PD_2]|nr:hypothetical protein FQN49_008098 [Arthroderma sp. PD_2]